MDASCSVIWRLRQASRNFSTEIIELGSAGLNTVPTTASPGR